MIAQASTLVLKIYICEIKKAQAKDACASWGLVIFKLFERRTLGNVHRQRGNLQQLFFRLFFFPMSAVLWFVVKVDNKHLGIGCFSAVVNHLRK